MKINSLFLSNFQGVKSATFDFGGRDVSIYGDNATGKTTVFNAITWLLFGSASTGAKNYTPKTKSADGDAHHLDHTAEAEFEMDDGTIVSLKKTFHEVYKKKRGAATEEFDGHSVDFFIDDVPTKEKDYTGYLNDLFGGAERMKMLTMPDYFAETVSWDTRRKTLLEMCGDVTDADVINNSTDLTDLSTLLAKPGSKTGQMYTVEEYKKIATERKKDINKQLTAIPARIDEANRAISDVRPRAEIEAELADINQKIENINATLTAGNATTAAITEIKNQIADANSRMASARNAYSRLVSEMNKDKLDALSEARKEEIRLQSEIELTKKRITTQTSELEATKKRREVLLAAYNATKAEEWDVNSEICPTCGRQLPEEQIAQLRADFNRNRSEKLEEINAQGRTEASTAMIQEQEAALAGQQEYLAEITEELRVASANVENISKTLNTHEVPFEETPKYLEITAELSELRAKEALAGTDTTDAENSLKLSLSSLQDKQIAAQTELAQIEVNQKLAERIKELEAEEKQLGADYEEAERSIFLCEQFIKTKVDMLTERINEKFDGVRFRLFVEQQNGGIKEDCEVMIPSAGGRMVPYAFANNAARINAGLEIINALSEHWGISMPVVIDNAESVTKLTAIAAQTIRLVVSEADKTLRVETQHKADNVIYGG